MAERQNLNTNKIAACGGNEIAVESTNKAPNLVKILVELHYNVYTMRIISYKSRLIQ